MADVAVKVGAETTELKSGLSSAEASVKSFASKVEGGSGILKRFENTCISIGTQARQVFNGVKSAWAELLAAFALFEGAKHIVEEFGKFQDISDKFDGNTEAIQRLNMACIPAGVELEVLVKCLQKARNGATGALNGNKELAEAFEKLNINVREFAAMNPEEQFIAIAKGLEQSAYGGDAAAAAIKLFGKSGYAVQGMLAQGELALRIQMAGVVTATNENIEAVHNWGARWGRATEEAKASVANLFGELFQWIDKMDVKTNHFTAWLTALASGKGLKEASRIADEGTERHEKIKGWKEEADKKKREAQGKVDEDRIAEEEKAKQDKIDKAEADKAQREADRAAKEDQRKAQKTTDLNIQLKINEAIEAGNKKEEARLKWVDAYNKSRRESLDAGMNENDAKAFATKITNAKMDIEHKKEQDKIDKEQGKKDKEKKKEKADDDKEAAKEALDKAKHAEHNAKLDGDALRKIGGGFAKSNYAGLSKEAMIAQRNLDIAQKQYDRLKEIADALRKNDMYTGISDE
jgi:hypothetical protein